MSAAPPFDLIVFGATGFVGTLLGRYLVSQVGRSSSLNWAIAGRSAAKLAQVAATLGPTAATLPRLVAEAHDDASLRDLCAQTRVVISTVGPYALYGEPLVRVCAEMGTDYCDLTGETQWVRRMIQTYGASAARSGARIVHCCGFDSIPSDLGVFYLQQQAQQRFGQPCQRVKLRLYQAQGGISGGTAASGINLMQEMAEDPTLQAELASPYVLCPEPSTATAQAPVLLPVQYDADFQAWVAPFVMAAINTPVVLRSNALQGEAYGANFQYDEGILTGAGLPGWLAAQGMKIGLETLMLAAGWSPTRWLLEQTIVPAAGEGPSEAAQGQGFYDLRLWGATATGETLQVRVTGDRDPGYGSTAKILGQAGLCLAQDIPKAAKPGGFWTPASLFGAHLIERLAQHAGVTFQVIDPAN